MLDGLEGAAAGDARSARPRIACSRRSASACSCCTTCTRSGPTVFQTPLGAVVPARAAVARSDQGADAPPAAVSAAAAAAVPARRPIAGSLRVAPASRLRPRARTSRSCRPGIDSSSCPGGDRGERRLRAPVARGGAQWHSRTRSSASTNCATSSTPQTVTDGAVPVDWASASRLDVPARRCYAAPAGRRAHASACRRRPRSRRTTRSGRRRSQVARRRRRRLELLRHRDSG